MQHLATSNGLNGLSNTHQHLVTPDLSTPEKRLEQLEILLYQKAQRGEDVTPCVEALCYFTQKNNQIATLDKIWSDTIKERSALNALQRVAITAFAILGMIGVFNGAFTRHNPAAVNPPSVQTR